MKPIKRGRIKSCRKTSSRKRVIAELDAIAREQIVIVRDENTCQRCGKKDGEYHDDGKKVVIQWSHVLSRVHYCIRWDPNNSKALCSKDHFWWENHKGEAYYWFSKNWPLRWEFVNERVRTAGPMKDYQLRELLEEMRLG